MIRVSQSKVSGQIVSRRRVTIRFTKAGYLWARSDDRPREERFWRDPLGVWRLKRSNGPAMSFTVWLEEIKP